MSNKKSEPRKTPAPGTRQRTTSKADEDNSTASSESSKVKASVGSVTPTQLAVWPD